MNKLIIIALLCSPLWGARAIVTSTIPGTVTFPDSAPYTSVTELRAELRLTSLSTCASTPTPNNGHNLFRVITTTGGAKLNLGCMAVGEKSLSAYTTGPTTWATAAELGSATDVIVRLQWISGSTGYMRLEAWNSANGAKLATKQYSMGTQAAADISTAQSYLLAGLAGNGTTNIAWIRVYNVAVSLNSYIPVDTGTCTVAEGCIGKWDFEDNPDAAAGKAGVGYNGIALNITKNDATFADTTIHPPITQMSCEDAIAPGPTTCTDQSFSFDGSGIASRTWQWVSGPARPRIETPRGATTVVSSLVEGTHSINLTVVDSLGNITSAPQSLVVTNPDYDGLPIYPTNNLTGTGSVRFSLASVPNATEALAYVRRPDGSTLPAVTCASSPCTVVTDTRQKDHTYQLEYRDGSGKVLSRSTEWAKLPVTQAPMMPVWQQSSGNTFSRPAWYLNPVDPARVGGEETSLGIMKFISRRLYYNGSARSPIPQYSGFPMSADYIDGRARYPYQLNSPRDFCETITGCVNEDMYLHMDADAVWSNSLYTWTDMGQFDKLDSEYDSGAVPNTSSGPPTNGVVQAASDDSGMTDRTKASWDNEANCGSGCTPADAITLSSGAPRLYFGYSEPFDEINFTMTSAGVSCTVAWEYWNGTAWASLTPSSGGDVNGSGQMLFTPPTAWQRTKVNGAGMRSKWWVRGTWSCPTTWPVIDYALGNDWRVGGVISTTRGWCDTDDDNSRILIGTEQIPYDPTPPAGCTAKFRYRARMLLGWAKNTNSFNHSYVVNGVTVAAKYLAEKQRIAYDPNYPGYQSYNGIYLDDMYPVQPGTFATTSPDTTPINHTEIGANTVPQHQTLVASFIDKVREYAEVYLPDVWITANTGSNWYTPMVTDLHLIETAHSALATPWFWNIGTSDLTNYRSVAYDRYDSRWHSSSRPGGTRVAVALNDSANRLVTAAGSPNVSWNRAVRGPMTGWASYLMGATPLTLFMYNPDGGARYFANDTYQLWNADPEFTLTAEIVQDFATDTIKTISVNDISNWTGATWSATYSACADANGDDSYTLIRIGTGEDNATEWIHVCKYNNTTLKTLASEKFSKNWPVGTGIRKTRTTYRLSQTKPPSDWRYRIESWGHYFPANDIDIGVPDTNPATGLQGDDGTYGFRKTVSGAAKTFDLDSGSPDYGVSPDTGYMATGLYRRDFTKSIVLWNGKAAATNPSSDYQTYDAPYALGGTYYPLMPDGKTDNWICNYTGIGGADYRTADGGCTSVQLRRPEGMILMKQRIQ